jgi:hypothetical protein
MKRTILGILMLLASTGLASAQQPAQVDGLEKVKIKNVDSVERRPGVDWKGYTKVLVQPVDVSFSRSWSARDYGTFGLTGKDVTRMRTGLAEITQTIFKDVLQKGGYTVVEEPAEGVLAVKPDIVDLYVNAPDARNAGSTRVFVFSPGEMRLALELSDSITGTVLARARDKKRGNEIEGLQWANSTYNRAEAERAVRGWATQLKNALDAARTAP